MVESCSGGSNLKDSQPQSHHSRFGYKQGFLIVTGVLIMILAVSFVIIPALANSTQPTILGGATHGNIFGSIQVDELNFTAGATVNGLGNISSTTGSLSTLAEYQVFNLTSTVYVRNGYTGAIAYSSSSTSSAIQYAINSTVRGGKVWMKTNLPAATSTINVTKNHIGLEFENQGAQGDVADGSMYFTCNASPCFNITGLFVTVAGGQFRTTVAGSNVFKVTGGIQVLFTDQNFFTSIGLARDILPYYIKVTANNVDVKISNIHAQSKNFVKVEKTSAAAVSRQGVYFDNIWWDSTAQGGTGFNFTANTQVLQNIHLSNVYCWNGAGTCINMTSVNNGAISYVFISNLRSQMTNGIFMYGGTGSGYISAIDIANAEIDASAATSVGINMSGISHSIQAANVGISMGGSAGAVGVSMHPSTATGTGFYFFDNLRIYDTLSTQTSIKANSLTRQSRITGSNLYMNFSSIDPSATIAIISPVTASNILSGTFAIDSTGLKTIQVAHNLFVTPVLKDIQVTVVKNTAVSDWRYDSLMVKSVNATYVVVEVYVSTQSATGGATAKVAVAVGPQ